MPQLVRNIVNGQHRPISTQYSQQARDLVKAMLLKDPKMRPGINSILSQPVVRNIISQFLNQGEHHVILAFDGVVLFMHDDCDYCRTSSATRFCTASTS